MGGRQRRGSYAALLGFVLFALAVGLAIPSDACVTGGGSGDGGNARLHLAKTVTTATVTPRLVQTFTGDKATAIPGDTVTYTSTVTNAGATLTVAGQVSAQNTGSATTTVGSFNDVVWTGAPCPKKPTDDDHHHGYSTGRDDGHGSCQHEDDDHRDDAHNSNHGHDVGTWNPLAGTAGHSTGYTPKFPPAIASGLVLTATPVVTSGVVYPTTGDLISGTQIAHGKTATWLYTATIALTPQQTKDLADPAKTAAIRNTFRAEVTGAKRSDGDDNQPAAVNADFSNLLFKTGQPALGSATDATVKVTVPDGTVRTLTAPAVPSFATLAPGATASTTTAYVVPVPAPKGTTETDAAYLARLTAFNGNVLTATATAAASSTGGPVTAVPASLSVATTEQVPVVGITKTGTATANAGDPVTYLLALTDSGAAAATTVTLVDQVPAGSPITVTGAPSTLAPGATATATAGYTVPAAAPTGPLTDTATVSWTDGHANVYGPVAAQATTQVTALARAAHVTLTPPTAGPNVTGTTQTLTATVTNQTNVPVVGVPVSFAVTGPNATTGSGITDANGAATFTYTGTQNGSDIAQATVIAGALTSNTSTIGWVTPIVPVSTTTVTGTFFTGGSGPFSHTPADTPAFTQQFPTINFNPPGGTIPHVPPSYNIGVDTRPFTDITTDPHGNYAGQVIAQGNGHQAALGDMFDFEAVFTGNYIVAAPGDVTFNFFSDDGFIFGVGNNATRVAGSLANPPADGLTPFRSYPVVGAYNGVTAPVANNVTVHFPAAGTYPYEVDYDECCGGQDALTMAANGTGVPAAGSLVLNPTNPATQPVGGTIPLTVQALTATGTPAANLPVTLTVSGVNSQTVTGTTDATGQAILSYKGTAPGTDLVLVGASLSGAPTVSNTVPVNWAYGTAGHSNGPSSAVTGLSPPDGSTITVPTPITATVTPPAGQTITTWTVTAQPQRPGTTPIPLGTGSGQPPATLATFDPTVVPNGNYTITVTVNDTGGGLTTQPTTIVVDGQLKLGEFAQTFQDMNVPVGGIPIQVTRTYDSFDRNNPGDFGNGWRLGVADYRVSTNRALGDGGWSMYTASCNLFCTTGFSTTSVHTVTVTDPTGHQETFDAAPTGGSNVFWEGDMAFTAHPGTDTTSKLEVANGGAHFYDGLDGTLRAGSSTGPIFDPIQYQLTTSSGQVFILDKTSGLVSETDRNGNTVTVDATGIHSSNGPSITWVRDGQGRIQTITGPAGTITYTIDANNDLRNVNEYGARDTALDYQSDHYLTTVTGPGATVLRKVTYRADGRVATVTDANGNVSTVTDDPNLRTERVDRPDGRGYTSTGYDPRGNPLTVDTVFDGVHHPSHYQYNSHDRPTLRTDPNGNTVSATYDSADNLRTLTDGNHHTTTVGYNTFNQPITETDVTGHSVTFGYDPATGDLLTVTDPDGHTRTYTYNPGGLVHTANDSVHPTTTYGYFPNGQIQARADGTAQTTTYDYTAAGQLFHEHRPEGTVTYTYNTVGARTGMTDPSGTTTFVVDALNRITSVVSPQGTIGYGYTDPLRPLQRTSMTTPTGTFGYHYTTGGQLDQVTGPDGTTTLAYDLAGAKTITRPNGVVTTNTYDLGGRVTDIEHDNAAHQVLAKFDYPNLDGNGNHTQVNETVNGQTWSETYGLDSLDRLQDVTYSDTGQHTHYDFYPSGNRQRMTVTGGSTPGVTAYHYDPAQQLTGTTFTPTSGPAVSRTLSFDNNGNETADGTGSVYSYNSQNQMTGATVNSTAHSYTFNADGVRVTADGASQLWDQGGGLPRLITDNTATQTYAGSMLVAETTGGVSTFPLADSLGSTRAVTTSAGTAASTTRYDAYGTPRATTGPQSVFGYTGQQTDPTGLVNLRARMYQPDTGRFLSADDRQPNASGTTGFSLYAYAADDPASSTDPSGHIIKGVGNSIACAVVVLGALVAQPPAEITAGPGAADVPGQILEYCWELELSKDEEAELLFRGMGNDGTGTIIKGYNQSQRIGNDYRKTEWFG